MARRQVAKQPPIFALRMRPEARAILDAASAAEWRSRAAIVDELIMVHLAPRYTGVGERLKKMGV